MVSGDIREARAIAEAIRVETASIAATLASAHEPFRRGSEAKWSAAEQVEHLRLSVRPLALSFLLPRFVLGIFGAARSPARTYDEVVADYQGRPFIPARLTGDDDLHRLLAAFQRVIRREVQGS